MSFVIGSFQTARRKTMSKDRCRKIAAMHVTLNAAIINLSNAYIVVIKLFVSWQSFDLACCVLLKVVFHTCCEQKISILKGALSRGFCCVQVNSVLKSLLSTMSHEIGSRRLSLPKRWLRTNNTASYASYSKN